MKRCNTVHCIYLQYSIGKARGMDYIMCFVMWLTERIFEEGATVLLMDALPEYHPRPVFHNFFAFVSEK